MKNSQSKRSRRNFLLAVGVGGASATAALVIGTHSDPQITSKAPHEGQGYRLTEHIRNYYRTAKV